MLTKSMSFDRIQWNIFHMLEIMFHIKLYVGVNDISHTKLKMANIF